MIRLIHIITDSNIGGAGVWVLNFLKAYDKNKYLVSVALPKNSALVPKVSELGITTHEIEGIVDESFSKKGIMEFIKLFKKEKPMIVHCHASLSARIAAFLLGIKTVNTRHCLEEKSGFLKTLIKGFINNLLSDIIIGVSKATCKNLLSQGISKKKLRLVYNGVFPLKELSDDEKVKIKKDFNIPQNNKVVGMIARLEPVKNHKLFLEAGKILLEKNKDLTLLIAGEGSQYSYLQDLSKKMGIYEKIVFCGYQKDISNIMNIVDVNVLTSLNEALSLSLIEGMSLKKPCVSTLSGGPQEVISDGVTGKLVDFSASNLSLAIQFYLDNPTEAIKAGEQGYIKSKTVFGIDKMIQTLDMIYQELVSLGKEFLK